MLVEVNVVSVSVLEVVVTVALVLVFVMLLLLVVLVVLLVVVVVLAVEEELLVQLVVLLLVVLELVVVVLELLVELVLLVALVVVRVVMEELLVEEELVVRLAVLPANRIDLSQALTFAALSTMILSPEASKPEILEALDLEIRLVGTEYIKHVHTKIYFTTFTLNISDAPKSCICSTTFYFHFEILFNLSPMRPKILRK